MKLYIKEFYKNNPMKIIWREQIVYNIGTIIVSKGGTEVGYHVMRDHPSDNPNKYLNADTYTKFIGANFLNHNTLSRDEIELVNTCVNTYMKTGKKIEV